MNIQKQVDHGPGSLIGNTKSSLMKKAKLDYLNSSSFLPNATTSSLGNHYPKGRNVENQTRCISSVPQYNHSRKARVLVCGYLRMVGETCFWQYPCHKEAEVVVIQQRVLLQLLILLPLLRDLLLQPRPLLFFNLLNSYIIVVPIVAVSGCLIDGTFEYYLAV
ncbi:hypothetical protein LguiB_012666 [Lonicera macranthoides]